MKRFLLITLALLPLMAHALDRSDWTQIEQQLSAKQFSAAETSLHSVLAKPNLTASETARAHYYLGQMYLQQNNTTKAKAELNKAYAADSSGTWATPQKYNQMLVRIVDTEAGVSTTQSRTASPAKTATSAFDNSPTAAAASNDTTTTMPWGTLALGGAGLAGLGLLGYGGLKATRRRAKVELAIKEQTTEFRNALQDIKDQQAKVRALQQKLMSEEDRKELSELENYFRSVHQKLDVLATTAAKPGSADEQAALQDKYNALCAEYHKAAPYNFLAELESRVEASETTKNA